MLRGQRTKDLLLLRLQIYENLEYCQLYSTLNSKLFFSKNYF